MAIQRNLDPDHILSGESYDRFIEDLCTNIPQCWDNDAAVESIIVDYLRQLENNSFTRVMHKTGCTVAGDGNCQ